MENSPPLSPSGILKALDLRMEECKKLLQTTALKIGSAKKELLGNLTLVESILEDIEKYIDKKELKEIEVLEVPESGLEELEEITEKSLDHE